MLNYAAGLIPFHAASIYECTGREGTQNGMIRDGAECSNAEMLNA